jgi:excinuclease UvrABC ATPase subunit
MSMATMTETQSPALHAADGHDLIRVHGARVNNLKDVSIEIPKRRLTVFTGVSGSGKSSLSSPPDQHSRSQRRTALGESPADVVNA